ncbi:MAG: hypothetical protein L6V93_19745 [Clostridiales bacterium]|nr:MAG: hypothetical protein L6V93_19745 [Clostridiales bacterium]
MRLEYDEDGIFEDRATQCVVNRNFPCSRIFRKRKKRRRSHHRNRLSAP